MGKRLNGVYSGQFSTDLIRSSVPRIWPFSIGLRWGEGPGACHSILPSYWIQFSQGKGRDLVKVTLFRQGNYTGERGPLFVSGPLISA